MKPKKESFTYDRTLRDLLQSIPVEFIKLLTDKTAVELLETSFPKVEEKRADLVVRLEDNSIFHLEVQSCSDKLMPKRMLKYAGLIYELYDIFPSQMVLYIGSYDAKIENGIKNHSLEYSYSVKNIKDFDCKVLIESESIDDNILAVLCKIENVDKFLHQLKKRLFNLDNKKQEDYLRKLFYILRLRPNLYEKIYNKQKEELAMPFVLDKRIDPLYKEGISQGITQGIQGSIRTIKFALELKFNEKGKYLYPFIQKIDKMDRLIKIQDTILKSNNFEEVKNFIIDKNMQN